MTLNQNFRENCLYAPDSTGWHRLVWREWGPADGRPILCVHYLTGNGRFFDWLARDLAADGYRVICPDMPGRGASDFLRNPEDYNLRQYINDIAVLLGALGITEPGTLGWIGASMGGFIGMMVAGMHNTPLRKLALIDVGPVISSRVMEQIAAYVARPPSFEAQDELRDFIIQSRAPAWGPVPDGYWDLFASNNARHLNNGGFTLAYDPALAIPFAREAAQGVDLWALWDTLNLPLLVMRGENSTLLDADTASAMAARGPGAKNLVQLETVKDCGHIPSLAVPDQITLVKDWLRQPFPAQNSLFSAASPGSR